MISPTSLDEIGTTVAAAARDRRPLRIAGNGTWMDAGGPVGASDVLGLASYAGVTDYVPGDLTITARAGTTLAELAAVTREHDQWLPLDPRGSADGTIGATVATGSYGPLAAAFGRPRDQVLGLEFVDGNGEAITVGARVVKNVAGFDLTRLIIGSWGTLGVITQITLRLRGRSDLERTVAVAVAGHGARLAQALAAARAARLLPLALELVAPEVAKRIGFAAETLLLARFAGNEEGVTSQLVEIAKLGETRDAPDDCWDRLRQLETDGDAAFRFAMPLSEVQRVWDALGSAPSEGHELLRYASVTRGVVRCILKSAQAAPPPHELLAAITRPAETARFIPERLSADVWNRFVASPVNDPISRGVKQAFDPENVLNPGILGAAA